jgi:hypothetical protein
MMKTLGAIVKTLVARGNQAAGICPTQTTNSTQLRIHEFISPHLFILLYVIMMILYGSTFFFFFFLPEHDGQLETNSRVHIFCGVYF